VLALASVQHALSATLAFSVADLAQPALTRTLFDLSTMSRSRFTCRSRSRSRRRRSRRCAPAC
jgi:hypothetical protein